MVDVPTAELEQADRPWVRALWDALQPDAPEEESSYVNGVTDYDDARVRDLRPQVRPAGRAQGEV